MNYKLQIINIGILAFIIYNLAFIIPVSAHVLKTDGTIGAVLHLDPNDSPIAGQLSNNFLEFKDTKSVMNLSNCKCQVIISENGKEIYRQDLTSSGTDNTVGVFSFTFPQKDVYQLKVEGSPTQAGLYPNFSLNYDVRVDQVDQTSSASSSENFFSVHLVHIIGIGIVVLFLVFVLIKQGLFDKTKVAKK
jgi:hypothetical protein